MYPLREVLLLTVCATIAAATIATTSSYGGPGPSPSCGVCSPIISASRAPIGCVSLPAGGCRAFQIESFVSAHELIPDEEGQEGEIVFAEVATVGTVSKDVLRATRPRRARNLATSRRYLAPSAYRRRAFGIRRFYRTHDDRGVVGRGSGEASLTRPAWLSDRRSLLRGDLTLFPLCSHNLPSAAGAVVELVAALMRESEKLTASVSRGFSRSDFLKWP